ENVCRMLNPSVIVKVYISQKCASRICSEGKLNVAGVVARFEAVLLAYGRPVVEEVMQTARNASVLLRKFSEGAQQFIVHCCINTFTVIFVQHLLHDNLDAFK